MEKKDPRLLKKYIHYGWGMGQLTHSLSPILKLTFRFIQKDPKVITKWIKMYFRYYQNWIHNGYDFAGREDRVVDEARRPRIGEAVFRFFVGGLELLLRLLRPVVQLLAFIGFYLSVLANPTMKLLLPIVRPLYKLLRKPLAPLGNWLSDKIIRFVKYADPKLFEVKSGKK